MHLTTHLRARTSQPPSPTYKMFPLWVFRRGESRDCAPHSIRRLKFRPGASLTHPDVRQRRAALLLFKRIPTPSLTLISIQWELKAEHVFNFLLLLILLVLLFIPLRCQVRKQSISCATQIGRNTSKCVKKKGRKKERGGGRDSYISRAFSSCSSTFCVMSLKSKMFWEPPNRLITYLSVILV